MSQMGDVIKPMATKIQRELIDTLARRSIDASYISPLLCLIVILATGLSAEQPLAAWTSFLVISSFGFSRLRFVKRAEILEERDEFVKGFRFRTLGMAAGWGFLCAYAVYLDSYHWQSMFTLLVMAGLCAGGTSALSPDPRSAKIFQRLILIPVIICATYAGNYPLAMVCILFLFYLRSQGTRQYRWLCEAISNQLQLREKTTALEEARRKAEAAVEARSLFLATMSHEIRTPLNGVIGMTELLLETPLNREQQDYTSTIRRSGEALLAVINDILDFSKLEAGMMELDSRPFSLRSTIEDVVELLYYQAQSKKLMLKLLIDHNLPHLVMGDSTRLKQLLLNLLSNGLKFTKVGSVTLKVVAASEPQTIRFEVIDTGIGIPKDRFSRLFQEFSQVDTSTSRNFGGTGLGLAICDRLVRSMEGRIGVESEVGEGSTFWFELKLPAARDVGVPSPPLLPPGIRILIFDDLNGDGELFKEQLLSMGATALTVTGETLGKALEKPAQVVLALSETALKGTLEEVGRSEGERPKVVLVASSYEHACLDDELLRQVDLVVVSPLRHHPLFDAIRGVVAGKRERQETLDYDRVTPKGFQCRVLVVEDNRVNQKLLARVLEKHGCQCDIVSNGQEAIRAVKELPYDLILMDYYMPVLDGIQATIEIRKLFTKEELPIIAVTANASVNDRDNCLEAGMNDYLTKPVRPGQIQAILNQYAPPSFDWER